jgi:uncharacterized membrane protein YccC
MSTASLRMASSSLRSILVFNAPRLKEVRHTAGPAMLFALRLWVSVCLALHVSFWLELDNPFWAGTSAAIVCQPQLGASLRKGWFRMIGTVIGATMAVVLTACFPQDRIAFLAALALWCATCAFAATVLRNFASYSAALAGYTAAIIAADTLGATGGPNADVFMLAVTRASEICIGIVCAGVVLAGTDLGGAQWHLAGLLADLAAEITVRFTGMLALARPQLPETQAHRRALIQKVVALDPAIDQALGESSQLRYHSPTLQMAVHGLLNAIDGWRGVATHLTRLSDDTARQAAETILRSVPAELRSAPEASSLTPWMADPNALRRSCKAASRTLPSVLGGTPSLRLLADQTAKLLTGMVHVLEALALLVGTPGGRLPRRRGFRLSVPDWLPPLVNAGRAFVVIGAVELFWIVTAWPDGAFAITFTAIVVVLLSPRGDLAYAGALAFILGTAGAIVSAAIIKFAVLPSLETFPAFCMAIGLHLIPVGFGIAQSRRPAMWAIFTAMAVNFVPLLQPTNQMSYDTAQFYNFAMSVFAGCGAAALSFRLLPPVPPALRTRRLLASSLRDLRRLATDPLPPSLAEWENRIYARLAAIPDKAEPLDRARLLAALSVGVEIIQLRHMSAPIALGPELDAALAALAQGDSAETRIRLARLDHHLASLPSASREADLALRARAGIVALSETLARHDAYFDA